MRTDISASRRGSPPRTESPLHAAAVLVAVACITTTFACTPVSKSFEIHTAQLDCDEANRIVHDSLLGMNMVVTAFKLARPGAPGYVRATKTDSRGTRTGEVKMTCEDGRVHIVPDDVTGVLGGAHEFERGVFLGVTGRAGLSVVQGRILGEPVAEDARRDLSREPVPAAGAAAPSPVVHRPKPGGQVKKKVVGVLVQLEPVRGFATVLDFEADLSRAGILPVKVTVENGTKRSYEFDPRDIQLRRRGSRRRVPPLSASQAVRRLVETNRRILEQAAAEMAMEGDGSAPPVVDPMAPSELGDVAAASRVLKARKLMGGLLRPSGRFSGFLYYQVDDYDRARITMIDVATGETEGFIVEF